jgi:predicted Zn-dependent protease
MPTSNVQRLADNLVTIRRESRDLEVEIFLRRTRRVRVERDGSHPGVSHQTGTEEGTAIRVVDRRRRAVGFAARNGSGSESIRWTVEKARRSMVPGEAIELPAAQEGLVPRQDIDEARRLPQPSVLDSYLDASIDRIRRKAPGTLELRFPKGWAETGITEECIVNSSGVRAVRVRLRSWSMLQLRWKSEGGWFERPVLFACRGGIESSAHAPEMLDCLEYAGREMEIAPGETLLFRPGAAAVLVRALVRTVPGGGESGRMKVGPAWHLSDDPALEGGLFGGSFDDTGAPAAPVQLADGRCLTGSLRGEGHLWRASYRDPPSCLPSNLAVRTGSGGMPGRCIALSDLRIHPLDAGLWALEALGLELKGGEPSGRGGKCTFLARPEDLIRRCSATLGPAIRSHNGVTTPALVF